MKPLIFLGSSSNIILFAETAEKMGIDIAGVVDDNYWGNTAEVSGIPFIGSENSFDFEKYRKTHTFFVSPSVSPIHTNDRRKRLKMIAIAEQNELQLQSLINGFCEIGKTAILEQGCYIGYISAIGHGAVIKSHSQIHTCAGVSHNSVIGKNSVVERYASMLSNTKIGENVHMGLGSTLAKDGGLTVGNNAVIHPKVTVMRDVEENEIVSLAGDNRRRIFGEVVRV